MNAGPAPIVRGADAQVVWDLPVRVVHWLLVGLLPCVWATAELGLAAWHRWIGYTLLSALLFRIYWGVFGSRTARFSSFLRGPGAVLAYVRRLASGTATTEQVGHNPAGGWSVAAMLSLLLVQAATGLFSVDDYGIESGPLATYVSFETGRLVAGIHASVFDAIVVVVAIHIVAVLGYWAFRKENLIGAMISGVRRGVGRCVEDGAIGSSRHAIAAWLGCGAVVLILVLWS